MASIESAAETLQNGKAKYQPSEFLKSVLGRPVIVKLNSGVDYRGVSKIIISAPFMVESS